MAGQIPRTVHQAFKKVYQFFDDLGLNLYPEGEPYSGASSRQAVGPDIHLAAGAGRDVPDTSFLAAVMGNIIGDALTKTGNYLGGVIGAFSVTGALAAKSGAGAVLGIIMDTVTTAEAAFMAILDGDSGITRVKSFFGVKCNNSTPGSGADFGMDLQSAAHDGFAAIDRAFYAKAPLRLVDDFVILTGDGAPTSGASGTGDNVAGKGSLYVDITNGKFYVQGGAITAPDWKLVTSA